jgi:acetolactate synthase I/II/III large subunit
MSATAFRPTPLASPPYTVAQALIAALQRGGIELLSILPGGPVMPLLAAAYASDLNVVLARQEGGAGFMADGYYRATGRMASVCVTAGPGTTNLVTAITVAYREQIPIFVVAAEVATSVFGKGAAQELDPIPVFHSITKRAVSLSSAERVADVVRELTQLARSGRPGPVLLTVPTNLFDEPLSAATCARIAEIRPPHLDRYFDGSGLPELSSRLLSAERPVLLAGFGLVQSRASTHLLELARRVPHLLVVTTPRAKGAFPDEHPQSRGTFGFAGHGPALKAVLEDSDLLIVAGSRLGELSTCGWHRDLPRRPIVQIDIEPTEPGRVLPVEQRVIGDIRAVLQALLDHIPTTSGEHRPVAVALERAPSPDGDQVPIAPARVMRELDRALPQDCPLFVDIGNSMAWAIHYLTRSRPNLHVNLVFGCMGHAVPAAIGACLGTGKPVAALVGDAALLMTGTELAVAAQEGLPLVTICLNDSGHGFVEVGRQALFADTPIPAMRFEPAPDLAAWASAMGVRGVVVSRPELLQAALEAALGSSGPTLLDVRIDPSLRPEVGPRLDALIAQWPLRRVKS